MPKLTGALASWPTCGQISKTWRAFDDGEVIEVRLRRVIIWYPFAILCALLSLLLAFPPLVVVPYLVATRAAC